MDDEQKPKMVLDLSGAKPELFGALAKAQAAVETVGKDGTNRHGGYNYATADSMIRGGRAARIGTGLALITAWHFEELDPPASEAGQWPGALVTLVFALTHESGGCVMGSVEGHAICSKARPIDKAVAAAATYLEGFVERNLMRLDRAEESKDDVDRREDSDTAPPQKRRQRTLEDLASERDGRPAERTVKHPETGEDVSILALKLDMAGQLAGAKSEKDCSAWYARWSETLKVTKKGLGNEFFTAKEIEELRHEYGRALKRCKELDAKNAPPTGGAA